MTPLPSTDWNPESYPNTKEALRAFYQLLEHCAPQPGISPSRARWLKESLQTHYPKEIESYSNTQLLDTYLRLWAQRPTIAHLLANSLALQAELHTQVFEDALLTEIHRRKIPLDTLGPQIPAKKS